MSTTLVARRNTVICDVIFILATIVFLILSLYGTRTRYRVWAVAALLLSIPPLIITFINNLDVLSSPVTPEVHGRVVDAENGKPLAGVNVKAGWVAGEESVAGSVPSYYYSLYKATTGFNGSFSLPRRFKALKQQVMPGFPLWQRSFKSVGVTVYPRNYLYKVKYFYYTDKGTFIVRLEKVKTDKEFVQNIRNYYSFLSKMQKRGDSMIADPAERAWLRKAYSEFERRYPNSREDRAHIIEIVEMLKLMKEPICIDIIQRAVAKYPDDETLVWFYRNNITSMKAMFKVK